MTKKDEYQMTPIEISTWERTIILGALTKAEKAYQNWGNDELAEKIINDIQVLKAKIKASKPDMKF